MFSLFCWDRIWLASECVIKVKIVVCITNASIMSFLLFLWKTQIRIDISWFLVFKFCFWLFSHLSFDWLSNLSLWNTLNQQVWFTSNIWQFLVSFWWRSFSWSCRSLLDALSKVSNRNLWNSKTFRLSSSMSRALFSSFCESFNLSHIDAVCKWVLMCLWIVWVILCLYN